MEIKKTKLESLLFSDVELLYLVETQQKFCEDESGELRLWNFWLNYDYRNHDHVDTTGNNNSDNSNPAVDYMTSQVKTTS